MCFSLFRVGGRRSVDIKEEPVVGYYIKSEPEPLVEEDEQPRSGGFAVNGSSFPKVQRPAKSVGDSKKALGRGAAKKPTVIEKRPESIKKAAEKNVAAASTAVSGTLHATEKPDDLFADIFQSDRDLEVLDTIINRARQSPIDEAAVGVMSDSDDDDGSSICEISEVTTPRVGTGHVHDDDEEEVGVMSSSGDSGDEPEEDGSAHFSGQEDSTVPGMLKYFPISGDERLGERGDGLGTRGKGCGRGRDEGGERRYEGGLVREE